MEDLVTRALEVAPSLAASRARLEASRQMVAPAGALPDPTLELMIQDAGFPDWTVGDMEMSMIGPQITQGFPFPGKRGARRAAASAEARIREREMAALRRQITLDVRLIYGELYMIDKELDFIRASRDFVDLLSTIATHHVETGAMDQEAVLKSRILVSRIEETRADLEADRAARLAMLNRWLDRPGDAPMGPVTRLPRPEPPETAWDSLAETASSEVLIRDAGVTAAERRLKATRLDLRPDFMAGAGVGFRGGLDPVVTFRFGMELPLWQASKQRPMIRAAQAELDMARHELRDARAMARSEAAGLRAAWDRTREQITRYEESFVPQTSLAMGAARSAYLGGSGDFSTVVEDFNMWLDARTGLARREGELFTTWARLDALVNPGPLLTPETREGVKP